MSWHVCEVYSCSNPDCRSKVVVLEEPRSAQPSGSKATCSCGSFLEMKPAGLSEPEGAAPQPEKARRDPAEVPE